MATNNLTFLTICLLLNLSTFLVFAKKEIQFIQVLSANKFYGPSYLDTNYLTRFEARLNFDYKSFLKEAVDIPNSIKMHLFNLGTYLRETYGTFLGSLYFDDLMKMQTTELPVSIIAGELINAGLWPPVDQQVWKEDLAWQPIPFDYFPIKEDQILLGTLCPTFEYETQTVLRNHLNLSAEDKNLLNYINREAQIELKNPIDVSLFYLAIENSLESNKSLPEWIKKIYPSDALLNLTMQGYDFLSKTTLQKRLNGGAFLKELIKDCKQYTSRGSTERRKISIYSGDERNLAGILNNLNIPIYELPKAGAALIFELYHEDGKYSIKINYYLGKDNETLNLKLADCQMFCPFEQLVELLMDVLPENEMSLCGTLLDSDGNRSSSSMGHSSGNLAFIAVFTAAALYLHNAATRLRVN